MLRNLGALGYFPSLRASLLQCIGDAREESLLAVERIIDNPKALPAAWGVDVFVRGGMRGCHVQFADFPLSACLCILQKNACLVVNILATEAEGTTDVRQWRRLCATTSIVPAMVRGVRCVWRVQRVRVISTDDGTLLCAWHRHELRLQPTTAPPWMPASGCWKR